ncbi:unannotated protein [freshwater metagenome]|uniref:Unannotated protein n=1 Tax=freshwater metagenome TaxID=449393 RepID=A0A6J7BQR0_9ZZZZ
MRPDLRRDLVDQGPEYRAESVHPVVPAIDREGVLDRELRNLGPAGRPVLGQLQVTAVDARCEVRPLWVDVIAVTDEVEVSDERWRQP